MKSSLSLLRHLWEGAGVIITDTAGGWGMKQLQLLIKLARQVISYKAIVVRVIESFVSTCTVHYHVCTASRSYVVGLGGHACIYVCMYQKNLTMDYYLKINSAGMTKTLVLSIQQLIP